MEVSVGITVEQHTQLQQPLGNGWALVHHHLQELMVVLHVTALERIQEVLDRRILLADRDLHSPLSHDGIGVAQSQLGRQHDLGTPGVRLERGRTAGSTSADHEHINGMGR